MKKYTIGLRVIVLMVALGTSSMMPSTTTQTTNPSFRAMLEKQMKDIQQRLRDYVKTFKKQEGTEQERLVAKQRLIKKISIVVAALAAVGGVYYGTSWHAKRSFTKDEKKDSDEELLIDVKETTGSLPGEGKGLEAASVNWFDSVLKTPVDGREYQFDIFNDQGIYVGKVGITRSKMLDGVIMIRAVAHQSKEKEVSELKDEILKQLRNLFDVHFVTTLEEKGNAHVIQHNKEESDESDDEA